MERKVYVFSKRLFDKCMTENNVPHAFPAKSMAMTNPIAYISISEPDEKSHWFWYSQPTVLNIDFWDVNGYDVEGIKGLTDEQAKTIYDFINYAIDYCPFMNFYVHCRAGASRSQAVAEFLRDCYGYEIERVADGKGFANQHVLQLLKRMYNENHKDKYRPDNR